MKIPEALKNAREKRGYSLRELGRLSGYDYRVIMNLEKGKDAKTFKKLEDLLSVLDCDIEIRPKRAKRRKKQCAALLSSRQDKLGERCSRTAQVNSRFCGLHKTWRTRRNSHFREIEG